MNQSPRPVFGQESINQVSRESVAVVVTSVITAAIIVAVDFVVHFGLNFLVNFNLK